MLSCQKSAFSLPDDVQTAEAPLSFLGLEKNDLLRVAEVGVLGIVSVLLLLLVVRPVVARLIEAIPAAGPATRGAAGENLLTDGSGGQLALPQGDGLPAMPPALAAKSQIEDMMNVAKVEGQVRASSIKRITEIVDQHPEETIAIIRNWMVQGR